MLWQLWATINIKDKRARLRGGIGFFSQLYDGPMTSQFFHRIQVLRIYKKY